MQTLKESYKQILSYRMGDLLQDVIEKPEYKELYNKQSQLRSIVEKFLPKQHHDLLEDYANASTELEGYVFDLIYIQAFKDGYEFYMTMDGNGEAQDLADQIFIGNLCAVVTYMKTKELII